MVRAIVMGKRQREEEDDAGKRGQSSRPSCTPKGEHLNDFFLASASVSRLLKWAAPINVRWSDM